MESTVSVSKGVFLFPNGHDKHKISKKKSRGLFQKFFTNESWYATYKKNWEYIEEEIQELHYRTYSMLLHDIVNYVKSFHNNNDLAAMDGIVPSATLLTGVNQPDHVSQFTALVQKIKDEVTPHIAMVNSQEAPTLKHLVENAVWQLIHGHEALDSDQEMGEKTKKLKKSQCTMKALSKWYHTKHCSTSPKIKRHSLNTKLSLVIIIPDFESFNCNVLQDFVMIASSYVSSLPIVFIFGVATSVSALHKSFPYHVSSKLLIKVFHSHSSPVYMNQVLEAIFLNHRSPLHLSGNAFQLLTDVFLFYDFSVTGLVQSIKYFMMGHYYGDNTKSLCCEKDKLEDAILNLNSEDLENIRQLLSFRPFVEAQDYQTQICLFEKDNFLKEVLHKEMNKLHDYLYSFYLCVRLLSAFVHDLPKNVIGKTVREIYTKCSIEQITDTSAFKECLQLIKFQSQVKLVETVKSALKIINCTLNVVSPVKPLRSTPIKNNFNKIELNDVDSGESFVKTVRVHLLMFLRQIENASTEATVLVDRSMEEDDIENVPSNRYKLKQKLLKAARIEKVQSEFEMVRSRFVSYIEEMFGKGLRPPHTKPFHEIMFFSDVANVKKQIVGSPRGALHTALSNPVQYLQCKCCNLPTSDSMSDSLPDVCLAYKLHRECGKHINLYDWLQAFAAILLPEADDDTRHHEPAVQTRFTRAVTELQFLGFIKSSKRKTDHVMRLTW